MARSRLETLAGRVSYMQKEYTAGDAVLNDFLPLASSLGLSNGSSVPAPLAGAGSVGPFTLDCVKPVAVSETATPSSDTGLPCTSALFDWLSFTFPVLTPVADVLKLLAPAVLPPGTTEEEGWQASSWVPMERGRNGYKQGHCRGNISVYHDGSPDMGVNVQVSGQGCRQLEQEQGFQGEKCWQGFVQRLLLEKGARFRRIDLAMDDRDGVLNLDVVQAAADAGEVVSLWRSTSTVQEKRLGRLREGETKAAEKGRTIYFGSRRNSEAFARFYNKTLEQLDKLGFEPAVGVELSHWVRCELSISGANAEAFAGMFASHGFQVVPEILLHYIDFKQPSETDTNRSRWETAPWWSTFLGNVRSRSLGVAPTVRTMEKAAMWIRKQAGPTLSLMFQAADNSVYDFFGELMSIVDEGRRRCTAVHRAMLAAHVAAFKPVPDRELGGVFGV